MTLEVDTRIKDLRALMTEREIDFYIIPTSDYHESEYVGDFFKAREFISGFTGSAGTVVIGQEHAGLWTDGRYFIQAQRQLAGSEIQLYPMEVEGVPTVREFIMEHLGQGNTLGFDGKVVNAESADKYKEIAESKGAGIHTKDDLIGMLWTNRPMLPSTQIYVLPEQYSGRSAVEKLSNIRIKMKEQKADYHIIASLYDIAWILNIRANDIPHVPVTLSFLIISKDSCTLFVQEHSLNQLVRTHLSEAGVTIKEYDDIYQAAQKIKVCSRVLLDRGKVNSRIVWNLNEKVVVLDQENPSEQMKAVKNHIEVKNTIKAHIKDGVAFVKFMYWLKQTVNTREVTEIEASDYLYERRKEQEHFLDLSFDTISGYNENAAMMHYSATKESNATLKPSGFLLIDSGGHYLEGSTDITRTIALGPLTDEMKKHFTLVCVANYNLAAAKFLYGCSGHQLDILARGPLWDEALDYRSGTGHGIGHILNVHEGPNSFRWKPRADKQPEAVLEDGMITTDEPGIYLEGQYGIRTENELLCRQGIKNEYGQFMYFQNITYAPVDLDAIDTNWMSKRDRERLNAYHNEVYQVLSPYLSEQEKEWLRTYTREL
ncbi:MAG: aminopeptidase P family protein [Lachnospiraceae bacterium]